MTTTDTAVRLPHAPWRLLNLLAARTPARATRLAVATDITPDELLDNLVGPGLVATRTKAGTPIDLDQDFWHDLPKAYIHLRPAGLRWVLHNPHNTFVRTVADSRRQLTLRQVCDTAGVRPHDIPADLIDEGLIVVWSKGFDEPATASLVRMAAPPFWLVRLTAKGRFVAGK